MVTALPVSSNHISVSLFFFLIPVIILNFTSFRIAFVKGLFLPEKVPFKAGRIHGFSNGNAADDAEPFGAPTKRNLRKITVLTVKQLSPQIGEITGVKRNCFLKNLRIVCRFLRMSFSIPAPESHRGVASLAPCRRGHRKVISHSDGYSVFNLSLNR